MSTRHLPRHLTRRLARHGGALAAALAPGLGALTGCGEETVEDMSMPAPTSPGTTSPGTTSPGEDLGTRPSDGVTPLPVDPMTPVAEDDLTVLDLVTGTAVGGTVDPEAVPLADEEALAALVGSFDAPRVARQVERRAARTAGSEVWVAVVAVGCNVPPGVEVATDGAGVSISARPVSDPQRQCLAPMTTVAVVGLPG